MFNPVSAVKKTELKLCGLPAVQARWRKSPSSFIRLFFDQKTGRQVGGICKALAAARKVYRCVEEAELVKVAGSNHHGGIVAIVEQERSHEPSDKDVQAWVKRGDSVLLLDHIGNPHNFGALARTAAFFGVKHLVHVEAPEASRANDAAYRVSEGGLEALQVWSVNDLPALMRRMKAAGYDVYGAATRGGISLTPGMGAQIRSTGHKACALALGNEEEGMTDKVELACTRLVTLQGTGAVESLNVSVAGALLIWELLGQRLKAEG